MEKGKTIIVKKELILGQDFKTIKERIEGRSEYAGLRKLCCFDEKRMLLKYATEQIHPARLKYPNRIPILFLFSNPHPQSVANGLFLSEPRSQKFWQRLFQSKYFCEGMSTDLTTWNDKTPINLGELMLNGNYHSKFLLYFHCLWPIPTNQVADLKKLFSETPLWGKIKNDGLTDLKALIKEQSIEHIVIFTGGVYHELTGDEPCKGRREKVMQAVREYEKKKDKHTYFGELPCNHAPAKFDKNIKVHLALDTRSKNMGKDIEAEIGARPFTSILDKILDDVIQNTTFPKTICTS